MIFKDQKEFMTACSQSTEEFNKEQFKLYVDLCNEENKELNEAFEQYELASLPYSVAECVDALIDLTVVCAGALYSLGIDPQEAWDIIHATNMAKVDPVTGKVRKREDGKVLKPDGWIDPKSKLIELCRRIET